MAIVLTWFIIHLEWDAEVLAGFSAAAGSAILLVFGTVNAPGRTIENATLVVLAAWAIAIARIRRYDHFRARKPSSYLVLLIVVFGTVTIASASSSLSHYVVRYALPAIAAFALASQMSTRAFRAYVRTMVLFAASQLVVAFLELRSVYTAPYPSYERSALASQNFLTGGDHRAEAWMGHPIPFSLLLIYVACLIWSHGAIRNKWLRILITIGCAWGVVESGTRMAFVAIGFVLFVSFLAPRAPKQVRLLAGAALAVAVGALLYSSTARSYSQSILDKLGDSGSYSHRSNSIEAIPKILDARHGLSQLFGSGPGAEFHEPYSDILHTVSFSSVDNQFTSTLVWGGLLAFVALIALFLIGLVKAPALSRALIALGTVYMFSFDIFRWSGETALLLIAFGFAANQSLRGPRTEQQGQLETEWTLRSTDVPPTVPEVQVAALRSAPVPLEG